MQPVREDSADFGRVILAGPSGTEQVEETGGVTRGAKNHQGVVVAHSGAQAEQARGSMRSLTNRANAPTPFEAVQRAAWQALNHTPMGSPGVAESDEPMRDSRAPSSRGRAHHTQRTSTRCVGTSPCARDA